MKNMILFFATCCFCFVIVSVGEAQQRKKQRTQSKASQPQQTTAQPTATDQAAVDKRIPLGQAFSLTAKTMLRVVKEDPGHWRSRYPSEFSKVKGILVAYTLRREGDEYEIVVAFATHYEDPARSDITLQCGSRRLNHFLLGDDKGVGWKGFFQTPDGRQHSVMPGGPDKLTFFYDLPTDCARERLSLSIAVDVGKVGSSSKKTFEIDAGAIARPTR